VSGESIKKLGFLAVFVGLFILVARLFYPFLTVIIWSSLFYAFLSPLYQRMATRKDGSVRSGFARNAIAAALSLGGVLLIAVPGAFLGVAMAKQLSAMIKDALIAVETNPSIIGLGPDGPIASLLSAVSGGAIELGTPSGSLRFFLASRTNQILGFSGKLLMDLFGILINLLFMVFTIFFLLVDGRHLAGILVGAIPIEKDYTTVFLQKFRDMGKRLVMGYFLVAGLQASIMLTLCFAFSIKGGLVIAFLAAIASFIPIVGTSLVLIPVSVAKLIAGDATGAVLFLIISASLIWTVDTFVRPLLLHGRLKIHPLLIFFSILGGLAVFKFNGIVLGPLILVLFFTALDFYERAYNSPPGSRGRRTGDAKEEEEEKGSPRAGESEL
jgi:predicted PurR-regulated permease PerM